MSIWYVFTYMVHKLLVASRYQYPSEHILRVGSYVFRGKLSLRGHIPEAGPWMLSWLVKSTKDKYRGQFNPMKRLGHVLGVMPEN